MTVKTLSQVLGIALPKLAPDLTRYESTQTGATVDVSGALGTVLSLSGRRVVSLLKLENLATNDLTKVKLTIDSVVINNVTGITVNGASVLVIAETENYSFNTSLLLEAEMATDTAINALYTSRPIL